jgi:hypothetical protein
MLPKAYRHYLLALLIALVALWPGPALAQDEAENAAPLYVRHCNATRLAQGEDSIEGIFNEVEGRLNTLEETLEQFDLGNLTYLEGITQAEAALSEWAASPIQAFSCLAPLESDVTALLHEILVAMLYGQIQRMEDSTRHLDIAKALITQIRAESQLARDFLLTPVVVATEPEATPEAEPEVTEEAPPPGPRTAEELTAATKDYLANNGVTVLIDASVQLLPDSMTITILLDRFVLNGADLDYENSLFTLEVLQGLLFNWAELPQLTLVRVQTFDAGSPTLTVEASGADFRARYYEGTLTEEDFTARLVITEG